MKFSFTKQVLRLVSIFLAIGVWVYVLYSGQLEVQKVISIKFKVPREVAIGNKVTTELTLKLRGPRAFIRNLSFSDKDVVVDLYKYPYRKNRNLKIIINPTDIIVPLGVDILSIFPDTIDLVLEKRIEKSVSVKSVIIGKLDNQLKLIKSEVLPGSVMIEGPIETMRKVARIYTEEIDLSKLDKSGKVKLELISPDPRIRIFKNKEFFFKYKIRAQQENMILNRVKIRFLSSHHNFKMDTNHVKLAVLISEEAREKFKPSDINIIAEVPEDKIGVTREVELKAFLPDGVHLLKITPSKIKIRVFQTIIKKRLKEL